MVAFLAYARRARRLMGLLLLFCWAGCEGSTPTRPNVVVYVIDTLRSDSLGAYGNSRIPTPAIDRIARDGVVFEQASSASSWTRASIATLLTGVAPPAHGTVGRRDALPGDLTTLGELLQSHGYATAFVTSNPNVGSFFGFGRGFDQLVELYGRREPGYVQVDELVTRSDDVTRAALDWIDQADSPYFLVVLSIDPHSPYAPPPQFDRFAPADAARDVDGSRESLQRRDLSPAQQARIRSLYDAEVAFTDVAFGQLVEELRNRGSFDETLLVVTSDHGEEFWERGVRGHGSSLAEAAIRIPLLVHFPASERVVAGTRRSDPAGLVDLAPSILDVIGLPGADDLPGRALFRESEPAASFSSLSLEGHSLAAARGARWKLVWDLAADTRSLYDLAADPFERTPVEPNASQAAREAHARLQDVVRHGLANRRTTAPERQSVGPLPPDVEATLRELGYLDDVED